MALNFCHYLCLFHEIFALFLPWAGLESCKYYQCYAIECQGFHTHWVKASLTGILVWYGKVLFYGSSAYVWTLGCWSCLHLAPQVVAYCSEATASACVPHHSIFSFLLWAPFFILFFFFFFFFFAPWVIVCLLSWSAYSFVYGWRFSCLSCFVTLFLCCLYFCSLAPN